MECAAKTLSKLQIRNSTKQTFLMSSALILLCQSLLEQRHKDCATRFLRIQNSVFTSTKENSCSLLRLRSCTYLPSFIVSPLLVSELRPRDFLPFTPLPRNQERPNCPCKLKVGLINGSTCSFNKLRGKIMCQSVYFKELKVYLQIEADI